MQVCSVVKKTFQGQLISEIFDFGVPKYDALQLTD